MRKYCITILLVLISILEIRPILMAQSSTSPTFDIIVTEVLFGTANSGTEEFIELYNNSSIDIDLNGWRVEYASSSATNWDKPTRTINLNGVVLKNDYILLKSTNYPTVVEGITYSSTLSQTGGNLRLVHNVATELVVSDLLSWGNATLGLGDSALAVEPSTSLVRVKSIDGIYDPILNNIDDFIPTTILTPLQENQLPLPIVSEDPATSPEDNQSPAEQQAETVQEKELQTRQYYPILISEILPNPAEPASDSESEFIEIYNPNSFEVDISEYRLIAGLSGNYKHIFPDGTLIGPNSFLVVTSADSTITLSNTAGVVKITDPNGETLSETSQYSSAPEGQAYVQTENGWQWTTTPTPNTQNIYLAPVIEKKTTKKTTPAKKATTKAKTSKNTAVKAVNSNATKDEDQEVEQIQTFINSKILAVIGGLVILYAGYEYRGDIKNKFHQLKANRRNRQITIKSTASGRHS